MDSSKPEIINKELLLEIVDGDHVLFEGMLAFFWEDLPAHLERITLAMKQGRDEVLADEVHGLKGALRSMAATAATESALSLELAAKDHGKENYNHLFHLLEDRLEELRLFDARGGWHSYFT